MNIVIIAGLIITLLTGVPVLLQVLKNHHAYGQIPVFIFSTSTSEKDMRLASTQGAAAYVTKPYAQNELLEICQEFAEYALMEPRYKTSELPAKQRGV